tara:strand:- start:430 stop:855 length:426 start_codon:yes stop_codon:yes gene_type:complete
MKIITQQLSEKLPKDHELQLNQTVNPQDFLTLYSLLNEAKQLTVYDITTTPKRPIGTIISVSDHFNRTGNNILIGNQKKLDIDFIDITKLYKIEQNAVNTDCCGKKLNRRYSYPSHFLCNISILAKALGVQKISAYLVNIL